MYRFFGLFGRGILVMMLLVVGGRLNGVSEVEYVTTPSGKVYPASRMMYRESRLKKTVTIKKDKRTSKRYLTYRLPKNHTTPKGTKRPKLVIIIDDIATYAQWKSVNAIPYSITPSIFPSTKETSMRVSMIPNPENCMIHLPMEACQKKKNTMIGSICISDSTPLMEQRIKKLKIDFPTIKIINNHTGSALSGDYDAFSRLYGVMREEGYTFVDSFTTPTSKVQKVLQKYGDRYFGRDVFLDNYRSREAIRNELRQAVRIAHKRGYAIAIGHPHTVTLRTLATSSDILESVEVVTMKQLLEWLE